MKLYATWTVLYTVAKLCPLLPDEGTRCTTFGHHEISVGAGRTGAAKHPNVVLLLRETPAAFCCLRQASSAAHQRRHRQHNIGSSSSSNNISTVMRLLTYARNDDDATRANARTSTLTTGTAAGERVAMARYA